MATTAATTGATTAATAAATTAVTAGATAATTTAAGINTVVTADDETIVRAKQGDATAWRDLYTSYAGRLLVWLRTLPSGDPGVAPEDIAADTWLTAATKIADFRGTSSDFAGWLFGIARLQARNASRRSSRRMTAPATSETLDQTLTMGAPAASDAPEASAQITWLLSHLSERERQVVACIDVVGLDVATTAAALRMTATAVRVARHRGLRRLRALSPTIS